MTEPAARYSGAVADGDGPSTSLNSHDARKLLNQTLLDLDALVTSSASVEDVVSMADRKRPDVAKLLDGCLPGLPGHLAQLKAVKLLNLLVAKAEFLRRAAHLVSRPYGLMVDPSNGCNLQCPGCIHSKGREHLYDWPNGLLSEEVYERFLAAYGPYAFRIIFFNWGEPLLNSLTPQFIKRARDYMLTTAVSTNLSMRIDARTLVESGLDSLIVSIDGATQETYEKYRRRGKLDLVLSNIRAIAQAKREMGREKPFISWQYLVFEHTEHEMDRAVDLAREVGANEIHLGAPYPVAWDDPSIIVSRSHANRWITFSPRNRALGPLPGSDPLVPGLQEAATEAWSRRLVAESRCGDSRAGTCHWLYKGLGIDALGRVLPCCGPPLVDPDSYVDAVLGLFPDSTPPPEADPARHGNLVMGQMDTGPQDVYNSRMYELARQAFADKERYLERVGELSSATIPICGPECWLYHYGDTVSTSGKHVELFLEAEPLFAPLSLETRQALTHW